MFLFSLIFKFQKKDLISGQSISNQIRIVFFFLLETFIVRLGHEKFPKFSQLFELRSFFIIFETKRNIFLSKYVHIKKEFKLNIMYTLA